MTTVPHVPAPPQGPGVQPPFPAPPVEGRGKRVGLSIGIAIGVVVLVCGGGLAAVIGILASTQGAAQERAHAAVGSYLNALRDGKYDKAYDLLCDDARRTESQGEFRRRVAGEPVVQKYTMGRFDIVTWTMPVDATYDNGASAQLEAYLGTDQKTGEFEVCEIGE